MILGGVLSIVGLVAVFVAGVALGGRVKRQRERQIPPFPGEMWRLPAGVGVEVIAVDPAGGVTYRLADGSQSRVASADFVAWCSRTKVRGLTGPG